MGDTPRGPIALICAYKEPDDAQEALRALLPVAGRTLVERQARMAAGAGAETIMLVTDPGAPGLSAALDRLRADHLHLLVAPEPVAAARAVDADDRILLIADGALLDEEEVGRLADGVGHALLTVDDAAHDERFERIDSAARWAGAAMIDGRLLRGTAAMLDDWDLQSTLLRRAVQEGARQVRMGADAEPVMAETAADLHALEAHILRGAAGFQRDWVSRFLLGPLEGEATRRLVAGATTPFHLLAAAAALAVLSAGSFLAGWLWAGLLLFLLATPLVGTGERLGRLMGMDRWATGFRQALPFTAAGVLAALGLAVARGSGWGAIVLALAAGTFLLALEGERPRRSGRGLFFAEPKGMGWLLLPFAAAGQWAVGLGALACYAAGSFFVAQRQAHRGFPKD